MVKTNTDFLDEIKNKFQADVKIQNQKRIWISIDSKKLIEICKYIKNQGYVHLSAISVTDWLEKNEYELTYHLWSYDDKILITIKTRINRKKPFIKSVVDIWHENAKIHERELHELFGVTFEGNHDLTPLFLEDWEGLNPFRKDFNWRDYVREKFYDKTNEREKIYYD